MIESLAICLHIMQVRQVTDPYTSSLGIYYYVYLPGPNKSDHAYRST